MPLPRIWTKEADTKIRMMRLERKTWADIGRSLGLSRNTVIERGRRILAFAPAPACKPLIERIVSEDPNRLPLPAGHPLTWSLLTDEAFPGFADERAKGSAEQVSPAKAARLDR
jgi:hypothetical protein